MRSWRQREPLKAFLCKSTHAGAGDVRKNRSDSFSLHFGEELLELKVLLFVEFDYCDCHSCFLSSWLVTHQVQNVSFLSKMDPSWPTVRLTLYATTYRLLLKKKNLEISVRHLPPFLKATLRRSCCVFAVTSHGYPFSIKEEPCAVGPGPNQNLYA